MTSGFIELSKGVLQLVYTPVVDGYTPNQVATTLFLSLGKRQRGFFQLIEAQLWVSFKLVVLCPSLGVRQVQ